MEASVLNQEAFVDDKALREKHIERTDVLNKVKVLSILPDDKHMTTDMVAEYYQVDIEVIRKIIQRHRDELDSDGLNILRGEKLKEYKKRIAGHNVHLSAKSNLTIINRRCCLRIGMLLRDSPVAKQVRTYLLNIEESATQQQRSQATRGSSWDGIDLKLYDIIISTINDGGTITDGCKIAAKKLNKSVAACQSRFHNYIKKQVNTHDLQNRSKKNRKNGHLKLVVNNEALPETDDITIPTWQELVLNEVIQKIINIQERVDNSNSEIFTLLREKATSLQTENERLRKQVKRLSNEKKVLLDELKSTQATISAAIKIKVNEELGKTFRMDRNGNLERV
ncbi:hypothetical protein [Heyndrickxia oleronia]|jgi:hypothetical protein|uniref:hypothetical protein n=1 Tax=Heyndrickxia oleronia TaxID=38875 RepID=UPI00242F92D0|nr:hypothetical protein [Heyndrickxia oleronia]MCI1763626.1 hypothetical protein [Heyndrickxia oleronia]